MKQLLTFTLAAGVAIGTAQITQAAGLFDKLALTKKAEPIELVQDDFDVLVEEMKLAQIKHVVWTASPINNNTQVKPASTNNNSNNKEKPIIK